MRSGKWLLCINTLWQNRTEVVRSFQFSVDPMAKFQPPEAIDFSRPESWQSRKRRFSRFRIATKLAKDDASVQIATLIYSLGPSAEDVFKNELVFEDDARREDYNEVLKSFDTYFTPSVHIIHKGTLFSRLHQLPGESLISFSSRLHAAAENCSFDKKPERIRDYLRLPGCSHD